MFTDGFKKTAYDEQAETAAANKVADSIRHLPTPEPKDVLKSGTRIVYWNPGHGGWKEGAWAHHTKSCSKDKEQAEAKKKYEEQVRAEVTKDGKNKDMAWRIISDRVEKKFPQHHGGEWKDEAIGIGQKGTIVRVEKLKTVPARYWITWDKHPDCVWGSYNNRDLKVLEA